MTDKSSVKQLIVSSAWYASSSIIGPLLMFGGMGYFIDTYYDTSPWSSLVGVLIAFVVSNVLLFKKVVTLTKDMDKQAATVDDKKNQEHETLKQNHS